MSEPTPEPIRPESRVGSRRLPTLAGVLGILLLFTALRPETVRAAWAEVERIIQLKSEPLPASPAHISDHEIEELGSMPPQQQAQRLVERAINHYDGAIELITKYEDGWFGQLSLDPQLSGLLVTAINSNDLRVRAASIEVYLAAYNLPKNSQSTDTLVQRIHDDPNGRVWALWMLGGLGNRGVDPGRAEATLLDYIHDPNEHTRYWAVEGLGLLGSDASIPVLLGIFHDDPSGQVRERAACSLAQSGMLSSEQRMTAVPALLTYMDDASLDATTRGWVFQVLRDITGASLGSDPAAWRNWWSQHSRG